MKIIIIDTPKGRYTLPLKLVAENRADYYYSKGTEDYKEEVEFVMEDDFEGIDWLLNNTNYEDWGKSLTKLNDDVNVTDEDFWSSSDGFEITSI